MTLATGGGATYDDRTRVVYTKVRPVLKTADFLAATPVFIGGLRLLDGNYAGPLIQVRRVDTGAPLDIYPTSTGALNTAAIATHCGSAVGTIAIIYDQSGAGRNATTAVTIREYRIWSGSAITTVGSSGKPFAFIDAEDRGYTFSIPTLSGTSLSAVLVGSLGNGVVNSTAGGRFMSLLDSSSTNTDGAATTRAILIGRAGGTTPSSSWQVYRNNSSLRPAPTTPSSRSARSSTGPTSPCAATTGHRFRQPRRRHSTAHASASVSPATAASARRRTRMSPNGGSSRPLSALRIATSCTPTRGVLRAAVTVIAS